MIEGESYEWFEGILMDCYKRRLRVINYDTGQELEIAEFYDADGELHINVIITNK